MALDVPITVENLELQQQNKHGHTEVPNVGTFAVVAPAQPDNQIDYLRQ